MGVSPNVPDDIDQQLNPHRQEEQERAAEHARDILDQRGVHLQGNETPEELADLLTAVERFDLAVQSRGGDSMLNAPDSSQPENPAYVYPERRRDEPARDYIFRLLHATEEILRGGRARRERDRA